MEMIPVGDQLAKDQREELFESITSFTDCSDQKM